MHIVVLGAGVIGVTTAWELAKDGHRVTVVERRASVAAETSRANGGQISPSHADPWAAPGAIGRAALWMFDPRAPLKLTPSVDMGLVDWLRRFMANCRADRHAANTEAMLRLALYSQQRLAAFNDETKLNYNRRTEGILHIYRDAGAFEGARRQADRVTELGCERRPVSAEECTAIEPALKPIAKRLAGGYASPADESGDARLFTERLARLAKKQDVRFRFDCRVTGLVREGTHFRAVKTDDGEIEADAAVVALGSWSRPFLKPFHIDLPVQPAKGYSVTLPAKPARAAPKVALIDDERKIVTSRLGGQVRIAGMAEFAGFDASVPGPRARLLLDHARDLLPDLQTPDDARFWAGLRPQTPDGVPLVGETPVKGLWLNTGHGTLGWTMAMGSARLVADAIAGSEPGVEAGIYGLGRF